MTLRVSKRVRWTSAISTQHIEVESRRDAAADDQVQHPPCMPRRSRAIVGDFRPN